MRSTDTAAWLTKLSLEIRSRSNTAVSTKGKDDPMSASRFFFWVRDHEETEERIAHANRLVGQSISSVRYFQVDYTAMGSESRPVGPRLVTAVDEWADPTWRFEECDSVDFGLELETRSGRCFAIFWNHLGPMESIGVREHPMIGAVVTPTAIVAVWDVSSRSGWASLLDNPISSVTLHYGPYDDSVWWCPTITLAIGATKVEILLGEGSVGESPQPSADNLAVFFSSDDLPSWTAFGESRDNDPQTS